MSKSKSRLLRFSRFELGQKAESFEYLGFEFRWMPDRQGAPRVKRREAILEVELPEVTPRVASGSGVWALTALADRLLPHLSTDARVSIFVRTDRAESPEVAVAIADLEPNPLAELAVELASVVPGARLAAGESGPLLLVPVAPLESGGGA